MLIKNILSLAVLFALAGVIFAAEDTAEKPQAISAEQIQKWVKQLDADEFKVRQKATTRLKAAGSAAIEAITKAATGESSEATIRAIDILKEHAAEGNEQLKKSAKDALEKIAKSDHPSASRRAQTALKPKEDPPVAEAPARVGGGIRIGGGAIQVQIQGIQVGQNGKRISVKNVNGNKEIDVDEDGKKIKITEGADGKIKVQITEKVGNMEKVEKYEAKDADELKKNHPDAHKIYEKYSRGGGGIIIREFRAVPGRGARILPAVPRKIDGNKKATEGIDAAIKGLEKAQEDLKQAGKDGAGANAIEKAVEQLEAAKKQLEQAKEGLK